MRGENMSRIETFVAASFAFAVTLLVISIDAVPNNFTELLYAAKQIPAFAASFAVITWIWHSHAVWSRRYGLEDSFTIYLSTTLIFLVLVYVYPLRIMMQSLMAVLSDGYLPSSMEFDAYWQVRFMFSFYALGFLLVCLTFVALHLHSWRLRETLNLNLIERFDTLSELYEWIASSSVSLLSLLISLTLPIKILPFAGYVFFLLFPVLTGIEIYRARSRKNLINSINDQVNSV